MKCAFGAGFVAGVYAYRRWVRATGRYRETLRVYRDLGRPRPPR